MSITIENGRFGNQLIRNIATSMIAKRHNLKIQYCNEDKINKLGIDLFHGEKSWENTLRVNDENFFSFLTCDKMTFNIWTNDNYFQTPEIIMHIYRWLRRPESINKIVNANPFRERYACNNDIGIHIRLGDIAINDNKDVPAKYYIDTINKISTSDYNNIFISTDSIDHPTIHEIRKAIPKVIFINENEERTIQFLSTCKYVILSHGSFSSIIGTLSFYSREIFYPYHHLPEKDRWYGKGLFCLEKFTEIYYK